MRIYTVLLLAVISTAGLLGPTFAQWPLGRESSLQESKTEHGTYVTGTGRFQVFVSPQAKGYTFMIDSGTGRVWIMKKDHTTGEFSFQRIPVDQVDGKEPTKPDTETKKAGEKELPEKSK